MVDTVSKTIQKDIRSEQYKLISRRDCLLIFDVETNSTKHLVPRANLVFEKLGFTVHSLVGNSFTEKRKRIDQLMKNQKNRDMFVMITVSDKSISFSDLSDPIKNCIHLANKPKIFINHIPFLGR